MYPYNLTENPFPSAPTPGKSDILLLGGKRHKKSKCTIVSCIEDLRRKMLEDYGSKHFRLVTVIHDVGSGKTHLALHLRSCGELSDKAILSFTDLSQVHPRTTNNIHKGMITGFHEKHIDNLRYAILDYLRKKAEGTDNKKAKSFFKYSVWDKMKSTSLENKMRLILENRIGYDEIALHEVLTAQFSDPEISLIQLILSNKFLSSLPELNSLEEFIANICALAKLNLTFLNRISVFEIDEFDLDKHSMDILKALINAHLPATLLLLVLTPSAYDEIRNTNPSLFDRLEKANYKIDLAGSNTLDEIADIIVEYMNFSRRDKGMNDSERNDLIAKIKILYDEFPDFRNIRSMINVMYHAVESAARSGSRSIDERTLDQTIAAVYPGLKLKESIMDVPVSEFMKIAQESKNNEMIKAKVGQAIKTLLDCANDSGRVTRASLLQKNGRFIEVTYDDFVGKKTSVDIAINGANLTYLESTLNTNTSKKTGDNHTIFSNNRNIDNLQHNSSCVTIDRHMLVDLIYFSNKYNSNQIEQDDIERALSLGKSIKLY
jgi:hypothetical protein